MEFFGAEQPKAKPSRIENMIFCSRYICSRNTSHESLFIFVVRDERLTKIGQLPSIADFAYPETKKYSGILTDAELKEFKCAIGLAAHGVGIGAFVYLRRIFESQIERVHQSVKQNGIWQEEEYLKARMIEKIVLLKDALPEFVVKNKEIYGILSKGIHDLDEMECLAIFPIVQAGLELMLDELLAKVEKQKKLDAASTAIAGIHAKIKNQMP